MKIHQLDCSLQYCFQIQYWNFRQYHSIRFNLKYVLFFHLMALCSSIQHIILFLLGIYQGTYPFALVKTDMHGPVYLCQEGDFESLKMSGFRYTKRIAFNLNSSQHVSSDAVIFSYCLLAPMIKKLGLFIKRAIHWIRCEGLTWTDHWSDRTSSTTHLDQVEVKAEWYRWWVF